MSQLVRTRDGHDINTISVVSSSSSAVPKPPLLLVHGFGGGVGLWVKNLETLAEHYDVHAIDVLGFGRSSRPVFPSVELLEGCPTEALFVRSIEQWREAMDIPRITVLGHSFGAFLASAYALEHPDRCSHLILADPWGFNEKPQDVMKDASFVRRTIFSTLTRFSPLSMLRAAGPLGPRLVSRLRPDLGRKFADIGAAEEHVFGYLYHLNAQAPSGELGFTTMSASFAWAKRPFDRRIMHLSPELPITVLSGSHTWMDRSVGQRIQSLRPNVQVHILPASGHHVYAGRFYLVDFNRWSHRGYRVFSLCGCI